MISLLDPNFTPAIHEQSASRYKGGFDSIQHANKSNALRRAFRLDGQNSISTVQRSRRLSDLGGVFRSRPPENPPGLGNWDHSCYQNSVIQGLASLESLPEYLRHRGKVSSGTTTKALRELTDTLNAEENTGKTFWTPAELKSMSSWQQQDAQEYYSKIMDALEKDANNFEKEQPLNLGLKYLSSHSMAAESQTENQSSKAKSREHPLSREKSRMEQLPHEVRSAVIQNPLDGLLAQRVGCQACGYVEGLSLVPFNCLTVPLGRKAVYDVRDCLDEYTALEPISGVDCTLCTLQNAKQRMSELVDRTQSLQDDSAVNPQKASAIDDLLSSVRKRLDSVEQALRDVDVSDGVLKKCMIPPQQHVTSTKSRQAVIARPPKALVVHINRSIFDELTGEQSKNQAIVKFPLTLPLGAWCLGSQERTSSEEWRTDPMKSMLSDTGQLALKPYYMLRAVVTHYGRHENGHYICYRRSPQTHKRMGFSRSSDSNTRPWWRMSDEDVTEVGEDLVLSQGGAFMLFYEQVSDGSRELPAIEDVDPVVTEFPGPKIEPEPGQHSTITQTRNHQQPFNERAISSSVPTTQVETKDHQNPPPKHDPLSVPIPVRKYQRDNRETLDSRSHGKEAIGSSAVQAPTISNQPEPSDQVETRGGNVCSEGESPLQQGKSSPDAPLISESQTEEKSSKDSEEQHQPPQTPPPATKSISPRTTRTGRDTSGRGVKAMEMMAGYVQAN